MIDENKYQEINDDIREITSIITSFMKKSNYSSTCFIIAFIEMIATYGITYDLELEELKEKINAVFDLNKVRYNEVKERFNPKKEKVENER